MNESFRKAFHPATGSRPIVRVRRGIASFKVQTAPGATLATEQLEDHAADDDPVRVVDVLPACGFHLAEHA